MAITSGGAEGAMNARNPTLRFLLEPLLVLGQDREGSNNRSSRTRVLILLDALDGSEDAGRGWEPVTRLVAKE
jgi:hypothetical protein